MSNRPNQALCLKWPMKFGPNKEHNKAFRFVHRKMMSIECNDNKLHPEVYYRQPGKTHGMKLVKEKLQMMRKVGIDNQKRISDLMKKKANENPIVKFLKKFMPRFRGEK